MKQMYEIVDKIIEKVMIELNEKENDNIGVFDDLDDAVEAAFIAQKQLVKLSLSKRSEIIESMREIAVKNSDIFAEMAVSETKMGNVKDKIVKNKLAALKTPGVEDIKSEAFSGDDGLTVLELSPFGVIGSITPTTNPTETIISNSIGMIAAGNGVVFSPHPTAKNVSIKCIALLNEAIINASGPRNVITCVKTPSIENANKLMSHPKINLLVATGGPAVVHSVLSSGKKAIGAGAGNPPAVIDETANIEKAACDVINGCSFDYNLPCIAEKEVIVVEKVADYLIYNMKSNGAYFIDDMELLNKLAELVIINDAPNKNFIGRSANYILEHLGISLEEEVKVISMDVSKNCPFVVHELMMPILPVVRVKDINEAIDVALEVEHGFKHTAIMHSRNVEHLSELAKRIQTTIFVKNGPSYAGIGVGGEGYTTFTIAGVTGEGLTSAKTFTRKRRCVLVDSFNIR